MKFQILLASLTLLGATNALKVNHATKSAWYAFDQGPNGNMCDNDDQCDGLRTCSGFGWCQGESRPQKNADYHYNQAPSESSCPQDPNSQYYQHRDYFCDGNRVCSDYGYCQGVSR